eukprot:5347099-Karenia_brevis.AAC.1
MDENRPNFHLWGHCALRTLAQDTLPTERLLWEKGVPLLPPAVPPPHPLGLGAVVGRGFLGPL